MGVSKNGGTPKSSILNRDFHYFHHPFWGTPIFGNTQVKIDFDTYGVPESLECIESSISISMESS